MAEAIVIIFFVLSFFLVWQGVLYLIKHPNITIDLDGKVYAHEPNVEELQNLVLTYLHNEETADLSEISELVGSHDITIEILALLEKRLLIETTESPDGSILISKYVNQ